MTSSSIIKKFYGSSIKRQLIMGIAAVHAVMMIFFVVDLVDKEKNFLHKQHTKKAQSLVRTLAANSTSWLLANDVIGLEEVVDSIRHYPNLRYAMIVDTRGRVLAHTQKEYLGEYISDEKSKAFLLGKVSSGIIFNSLNIIDVVTPVRRGSQHIGWARIGLGKEDINNGLDKIRLDGFIYVVLAIFTGMIFAYFMAVSLTKSIDKIIQTIKKTKKGDNKARTNLQRHDEMGLLSKEFDNLLQKLSDQYTLLNSVIESTPDLIFFKDYKNFDGRYIGCNEAFCKFTGIEKKDIIGKNDFDLFDDPTAVFFRSKDQQVLLSLDSQRNEEWVTYPDGRKALKDMVKTPLYDSENNLVGIIGIGRDITQKTLDRKELEKKNILIYQQSKLASLGEMLANIAHQWRQPLNVVSTAASAIQLQKEMGTLNDELMVEELEAIINSARYLSQTIDDFRNFISNSKAAKQEVYIKSVIDELQSLVKASLVNNFIDFEVNIKDNPKMMLSGSEFLQALLNIISNAKDVLKNSDKNIKVIIMDVEKSKESNSLSITIYDNGGGVPDKIKEKIFEPYFTTKHQFQGTGIGLYMTLQIITKSLNGNIDVSNTNFEYKGEKLYGASFKITIPLGTEE